MGETRKRCQMPTISRGKTLVQISSMWMVLKNGNYGEKYERRNLDGRKLPRRRYNMMLPVEKEERCTFGMTIYFKKKDGLFYLSRHGSGCEHKGHSMKTNVKTSAANTTKSELKTVKSMVQSYIKARGAASLLEMLTGKKYTVKQVAHLRKKHRRNI
jgi:hypothetical protein